MGKACVSMIITDLCVFDVDFTNGLRLVEFADGVTVDDIESKTEPKFPTKVRAMKTGKQTRAQAHAIERLDGVTEPHHA